MHAARARVAGSPDEPQGLWPKLHALNVMKQVVAPCNTSHDLCTDCIWANMPLGVWKAKSRDHPKVYGAATTGA